MSRVYHIEIPADDHTGLKQVSHADPSDGLDAMHLDFVNKDTSCSTTALITFAGEEAAAVAFGAQRGLD